MCDEIAKNAGRRPEVVRRYPAQTRATGYMLRAAAWRRRIRVSPRVSAISSWWIRASSGSRTSRRELETFSNEPMFCPPKEVADPEWPGTLAGHGPVAQSGQSSGLIIRRLQVQILPGPQRTDLGEHSKRGGARSFSANGRRPGFRGSIRSSRRPSRDTSRYFARGTAGLRRCRASSDPHRGIAGVDRGDGRRRSLTGPGPAGPPGPTRRAQGRRRRRPDRPQPCRPGEASNCEAG